MYRLAVLLLIVSAVPALAQTPRAVSPDGKLEAIAKDKIITVSTGQPPKILMKIAGHTSDITALIYTPDGKMLLSADKGGSINTFDQATGKQIRKVLGPKGISGLSISPDGRTLFVKAGKVTKKYNVATGAEIK
jgi:WD40 repeat protein